MNFGATQQITVSSSQYTQITALSDCRQVTVGEDPSVSGFPTTDFLVAKPSSGNQPRRITGGQNYTFVGPFRAGAQVGQVKAVANSTTFYQDES